MWILYYWALGFCVHGCILLTLLELCFGVQLSYLEAVWSFQTLLGGPEHHLVRATFLPNWSNIPLSSQPNVLFIIWGFSNLTVGTQTSPSLECLCLLLFGSSFLVVWYFPTTSMVLISTYLQTLKGTSAHFFGTVLSMHLSSLWYCLLQTPAVLAFPNS